MQENVNAIKEFQCKCNKRSCLNRCTLMYILATSFTVFTLKLFNLIIFTKRSVLDV